MKDILKAAGIVGAGGAGFPTYAKLNENADTLILNCAECEPLLTLHRQLLKVKAAEILHALNAIASKYNFKNVIIGIKSAYTATLEALYPLLANYNNIKVKELAETYPAGDEVVLIYEITGKVVPAGGLPINCGVIVFNVETMFNVYNALNGGAAVTSKYVTISGAVKNPITVCAPLGSTFGQLIEAAGGSLQQDYKILVGGVMMGKLATSLDVVTKTTNAVLVFPKNHVAILSKTRNPKIDVLRTAASCCQCKMCTDLCPRHLIGHPIDPSAFMHAVANKNTLDPKVYLNAMYCSGCGLCESFACMQSLSPKVLLEHAKAELRKAGVKPQVIADCKPIASREMRKVPVARLAGRMDLIRYEHEAPITQVKFSPDTVRLSLRMNIGAASVPVVAEGDSVKAGQLIAKAGEGLGVDLHASISGKILTVGKYDIIIKSEA